MGMTRISTYLPPWEGKRGLRIAGHDEDAVTMSVAAGLLALQGVQPESVIVVTRQPALLEGGSAGVLCAGLGISENTHVVEQIGGAAALLDTLSHALPNTLVIAVDIDELGGSGAAAVLVGDDGAISRVKRVQRSLPTRTRHLDGAVYQDDDARLTRERGVKEGLLRAALDTKPLLIAGLSLKDSKAFCALPDVDANLDLPTLGAASPIFALALLSELKVFGLCAAFDQACLSVVNLNSTLDVKRLEPAAQAKPKTQYNEGADIKFALAAYDRAFESKLKLEAGRCNACGQLAMPARYRCIQCGSENNSSLTPLPRTAEAYTTSTIHIPIPGLVTPYTLVMAQLDGVDVRVLVTLTDSPPNAVSIGDKGAMVFRRVAMRSGVPDYGYAFSPLAEQISLQTNNQTSGEAA